MSWYSDIKAFIANNITTNHARAITGAKMNTVLNDIVDEVDGKVDKVSGKGLSTNDYNNTEKAKVANAYSKPSGGIPKTDLASAVQTSLGKADTAVQTETDPTVPSWAKAQTKPAYTASEVGAIPDTDKGANGGVATLDSGGKVPQSQLPSYVDDVLEYANLASFPATGESGKIYVALDTNKTYRWSGSAYVEIAQGLALGETSSTAFAGDRGKAIEDKIPSNASSSNKLATKTESVPAGGTTGQVLAKKSNTDNDLEWVNQSGGGGGSSNYNDLSNKPSINNVTLSGNKTAAQLGLQETLTIDAAPTEDSANPVQSGGVYEALNTLIPRASLFGGFITDAATPNPDDIRRYFLTNLSGELPNFDYVNLPDNGKWKIVRWNPRDAGWDYESIDSYTSDVIDSIIAGKLDEDELYTRLGFMTFDPSATYTENTAVVYNGQLYVFAADHTGPWDAADVMETDLLQVLDIEYQNIYSNIGDKVNKVNGATNNNFVAFDNIGGIKDSGKNASDFATAAQGTKADTAYQLPTGGIPASDLAAAVQTSLGKADTALQSYNETDPVFSASPAAGITSGDISDWDDKAEPIPVVNVSTVPASMDADKFYDYGTLSADIIFPSLNTPSDATNAHVFWWTFKTGSTAPNVGWPASGITEWSGGSPPDINASTTYEIMVNKGFASYIMST